MKRKSEKICITLSGVTIITALLILSGCIPKDNSKADRKEDVFSAYTAATESTEATTPQTSQEQTNPPTESLPAPTEAPWEPDETDVAYIAKTIFGEASVVTDMAKQAAVGWCILNRVDSPSFPNTVAAVVTQPYQFCGYRDGNVPEDYYELARDILIRHHLEQMGVSDVGRTLPPGWCYFDGNAAGTDNVFTYGWHCGEVWDWSLPSPYCHDD